jgi:hypothetical protein
MLARYGSRSRPPALLAASYPRSACRLPWSPEGRCRVPPGAAFGRPFPRLAAAGPRPVVGATRSVDTDVKFCHGVVCESP